jgi:hypothetical protein
MRWAEAVGRGSSLSWSGWSRCGIRAGRLCCLHKSAHSLGHCGESTNAAAALAGAWMPVPLLSGGRSSSVCCFLDLLRRILPLLRKAPVRPAAYRSHQRSLKLLESLVCVSRGFPGVYSLNPWQESTAPGIPGVLEVPGASEPLPTRARLMSTVSVDPSSRALHGTSPAS